MTFANDFSKIYNCIIKKPEECTKSEIKNFLKLAVKIGQNTEESLQQKIKNALQLGFCYKKDKLVGIAAIKQPPDYWRKYIFGNAWSIGYAHNFRLELGFAYTKSEYRKTGICSKLTKDIVFCIGSKDIFATCKIDNMDIQNILKNFNFQKIGKPIMGTIYNCDGYYIQLFVRK